MHHVSRKEWALKPSPKQRFCVAIFWLACATAIFLLLDPLTGLLFVALFSRACAHELSMPCCRVVRDQDGWWLEREKGKAAIVHGGLSNFYPNTLFLRFGLWPWQTLVVRPDSLKSITPMRAFRALRRELYNANL